MVIDQLILLHKSNEKVNSEKMDYLIHQIKHLIKDWKSKQSLSDDI